MPYPIIPENITVHLGEPEQAAENITLPFVEYIKNVASGEIYPTWPEQALRANMLAQITFALNRIYTEWYPSQGYDFDITSVVRYDQTFAPNREIFANISALGDELFNDYVVAGESIVPLFTAYCNGTTSVCEGLSQWGTVELAEQGRSALDILRYYYGDEVMLVENAPTGENLPSYPGIPLARGQVGEDIRIIQRQLDRIGEDFPAIPKINDPDGIYDSVTAAAVTVYQDIFDLPTTGIVDKATWYSIKRRYVAVKGLSNIIGEGLLYSEAERLFPRVLQIGDSGIGVRVLQYYLNFLAFFNASLSAVPVTGIFDAATAEALRVFEAASSLPVNGVADRQDWSALTVAYNRIIGDLPEEYREYADRIYPGAVLTLGDSGQAVLTLQQAINSIAQTDSSIPRIAETGFFDRATADAVNILRIRAGLSGSDVVGPALWENIISRAYAPE